MSLTLYYHPLSSYCHKVLVALDENGTTFDKRLINLGQADDRAELAAIWPLCKFPVIRDHARQRDVAESSVIIEYLDRFFPGQQPLIPADWDTAIEVRLWDRIFDNHVQGPMQSIVSDRLGGAKGDMSRARASLQTVYQMIDRHMATKTWAAGEAFSMADCAAVPALFYANTIEPLPDACLHLHGYFERLMTRPSAQKVLAQARPYFNMYPFQEGIPERFR